MTPREEQIIRLYYNEFKEEVIREMKESQTVFNEKIRIVAIARSTFFLIRETSNEPNSLYVFNDCVFDKMFEKLKQEDEIVLELL